MSIHRKGKYSVVIIARPAGWQPESLSSAPPVIQIVAVLANRLDRKIACRVAAGYNRSATFDRWAMLHANPTLTLP